MKSIFWSKIILLKTFSINNSNNLLLFWVKNWNTKFTLNKSITRIIWTFITRNILYKYISLSKKIINYISNFKNLLELIEEFLPFLHKYYLKTLSKFHSKETLVLMVCQNMLIWEDRVYNNNLILFNSLTKKKVKI